MDSDKRKRIEERAHRIWEAEGRPDNQHDSHWQRAERELADEDGAMDLRPGEGSDGAADGLPGGRRTSRAKPNYDRAPGAGTVKRSGTPGRAADRQQH